MNIKSYIIMAAAGLAWVSCGDDFLDVSSKTESNTETFYKTESDAYRALIGCYAGWREVASGGGFGIYIAAEAMGPDCYGGTGTGDEGNYQVVDRFDQSQNTAGQNIFETDWKSYYAAVYRCNELISRQDQIEWGSNRGLYMGECYGLRGLLYFDMVRLWGNIPLLTAPSDENLPQSSPQEVFQVIFSDLKYAAESIPADAYPKAKAGENDGRFTRYAAEALLARAYLYYKGVYGEEPDASTGVTLDYVKNALSDIITSEEFALVPEFKNLWRPAAGVAGNDLATVIGTYAGDGNSETILAQKFTATQDYNGNNDGNRWMVMMGTRGVNHSPYGYGWGACTVNPKSRALFATGDTRLSATIIDHEREGYTSETDYEKSCIKDTRDYTGYSVKKYCPMATLDGTSLTQFFEHECGFQEAQFQDYVVIRYADVLLMAAELQVGAYEEYFDQVRRRAFTQDGVLSTGYQDKSATLANIQAERRLEFMCEGITYWDLLRQGIDVAAQTIAASGGAVLKGGIEDHITISAEDIKAKQGLSQIPNNQIVLSNYVLKQNAGW